MMKLTLNSPVGPLLAHLRTPLYRNGYALTLSAGAGAGLGMVFWLLAARLYSPAQVGLNSAMIAAMLLLSGISQLGLNSALLRFVPRAGRVTPRLVVGAYLVGGSLAALLGALFALGTPLWSPALADLSRDPLLVAGFAAATLVWTLFALQESVLTGLRQAQWVPLENVVLALGKIGLLVGLAAALPGYGVFGAWMLPLALLLPLVAALVFRRLIPQHVGATEANESPLDRRQFARYTGGAYAGSLLFQASTTLLPIIVANVSGATASAHFYLPWVIATTLQTFAANMGTSLTVEAVREQDKLGAYCRGVLAHTARVLLPLIAALALAAPYLLHLFGASYSDEGSGLLRLLLLASVPNMIVAIFLSIARVQQRVGSIVAVQGALCLLVLGLGYWLLQGVGIAGIGVAYLISQTVVALYLLLAELRPLLWPGKPIRGV